RESTRTTDSFNRRRFPVRLECLEDRVTPAFTGSVVGTTATLTGDANGDVLILSVNGANLQHNRFTLGDAGFNRAMHFDSSKAGDQTLPAAGSTMVTVNAGDGADLIFVGDSTTPASAVSGRFVLNGQGGADSVFWDNSADVTARTINIQGGILNQVFI